ncbi:MAG: hypothetical protein KQH79_01040 [Bacteroidetes bacterium]|nr:hypothetical protein [Bacteroidota bacterium]
MKLTNVTYELKLSSPNIIVTSIEFHGIMKIGGHPNSHLNLSLDRNGDKYSGKFISVIVNDDCTLIKKIAITAEGPTGSFMELKATLCNQGEKKLLNQPIKIDDTDGSLTEILLNTQII